MGRENAIFTVMPDLIRHPEVRVTRLETGLRQYDDYSRNGLILNVIPVKAGIPQYIQAFFEKFQL
jgi:hypothetical protein